METKSLRCSFEVTAGLIPGQPLDEHTKRFHILSDEWHGTDDAGRNELWMQKQGEAMIYALTLQAPNYMNWVRLDWIWY